MMIEDAFHYKRYSKAFIATLVSLFALGAIMVYSASYIYAKEIFGNSSYFLYKQLIFILIGSSVIFLSAKSKKSFWLKYCDWVNLSLIFLLVLTFVPGIGYSIKGASRWLSFGGLRFQPGEYLKVSLLLCTFNLVKNSSTFNIKEKWKQVLAIIAPLFLLLNQPDFGTFFICCVVVGLVLFLSSFDRKKFYAILTVGLISVVMILVMAPYRVKRLLTFLDPWKDPKSSGFQIIQSYLAFANGSLFGQGLGNSNEKLFYLPEAHNDFIFSVIGEELGFLGVFFVILLFLALLYFGLKMIMRQKTESSIVVGSSLLFLISFQAFFNMGVVLGLLPTKGLNLPFISYGGSSLISNSWIVGLFICFTKLNAVRGVDYFETSSPDTTNSNFKKII